MARWRKGPQRPVFRDWVLDPRTDPAEAWAWLDKVYLEDTDEWFAAFTVLCSIPRYLGPPDGTLA